MVSFQKYNIKYYKYLIIITKEVLKQFYMHVARPVVSFEI